MVMRFAYPFQKIVDLKMTEKKQAESVLSQAIGYLASKEQQLMQALAEKLQVQEQLAAGAGTSLQASELSLKQQYVDYLEARIRAAQIEIRSAEHQVETRRLELNEKTVDQKVWLKAREKAFLTHRLEAGKKSQNELDDIVSARWQRV